MKRGTERPLPRWFERARMSGAREKTAARNQRNLGMRKQLLLSTAALLAGIAMASAQGTPGGMTGGKSPGATTGHEQPATQGRSSEPRAQEHGRSSQPQRSEQNEHRTTGQATPSAKEPASKSPSAKEPAAKSPSAKEPA